MQVSKFALVEHIVSLVLHPHTHTRNQPTQPEGEHQLGSRHQQLGGKSLEESRGTLVLNHFSDNLEPALGVLKVPVLDARLDDVQRGRNHQGRRGTGNRGNKVLSPSGLAIVRNSQRLLSESAAPKELQRVVSKTSERHAKNAVVYKIPQRIRGYCEQPSMPSLGTDQSLRRQQS